MKSAQHVARNSTRTTQKGITPTRRAVIQRQELFIKLYVDSLFSITEACKLMPINRSTYYLWLKDPEFAQKMDDARETKFDFIESALMKQIKKGDTIAVLFACKCLLKQRNYVEQTNHRIEVTNVTKEQRDSIAAGLIQEIQFAGKLNLPDNMRKTLRLPEPAARDQTVDIDGQDHDPGLDDHGTGQGVKVLYNEDNQIINVDPGPDDEIQIV